MIGPQPFLPDGQGAAVERLRLIVFALILGKPGELGQGRDDVQVIGTELTLRDRHSTRGDLGCLGVFGRPDKLLDLLVERVEIVVGLGTSRCGGHQNNGQ